MIDIHNMHACIQLVKDKKEKNKNMVSFFYQHKNMISSMRCVKK